MNTSLFELFKIGIGPSSSHTVGPMRAAVRFVRELEAAGGTDKTVRVTVDLYGSLALTGKGHGTDRAVLLGLMGEAPDRVDPATVEEQVAAVRDTSRLRLGGLFEVPFHEGDDLRFLKGQMYPVADVVTHPNGVRFTAFDAAGMKLAEEVFYSIGGGFIVSEAELVAGDGGTTADRLVPYPFHSAEQMLRVAGEHGLTIAELVLANECALLADERVKIVRPEAESLSQGLKPAVFGAEMSGLKSGPISEAMPLRPKAEPISVTKGSMPLRPKAEPISVTKGSMPLRPKAEPISVTRGSMPLRPEAEALGYQSGSISETISEAQAAEFSEAQAAEFSEAQAAEFSEAQAADRVLEDRVRGSVLALWRTMESCTARGMEIEGILPGGLKVRRRAPKMARRLRGEEPNGKAAPGKKQDPLSALDWVTMWAMAVNEENAAGGRVVTAPTNGAAGVIPAIALYYLRFLTEGLTEAEKKAGLLRYFLTAAAIGILYKENASISGAEVGCQGEVGVACSMAAGGLVAAQDGTNDQVEHAAEVAMEHNLGMTCDPIAGLVQIPCIERNGMGAVKAINASRIAMHETEGHKLSLDQIIKTMYETGMDMQSRYKETSLAGLALNVIEC